jgi:hypothetical protein
MHGASNSSERKDIQQNRNGGSVNASTTWTDQAAMAELESLVKETIGPAARGRYSAEHARWRARTLTFLEELFGRDSHYCREFARLKWAATQVIIDDCELERPMPVDQVIEQKHDQAYRQQVEAARGLLLAATDELRRRGAGAVYRGKSTPAESSGILRVLGLIERKLRKAVHSPPSSEKEVQDAFETLLHGADLAFARETERITYSSKTYVPDFVFARLDLVVEFKLCNHTGREKQLIGEINDDVLAYKSKFGNVIFVVYDTAGIRDVERFCSSFEQQDHVLVRMVKH